MFRNWIAITLVCFVLGVPAVFSRDVDDEPIDGDGVFSYTCQPVVFRTEDCTGWECSTSTLNDESISTKKYERAYKVCIYDDVRVDDMCSYLPEMIICAKIIAYEGTSCDDPGNIISIIDKVHPKCSSGLVLAEEQ